MAIRVSILTEFYKFVDEISLHENNYVSKQSLSGIFSFTEKKQWDHRGKKNWFLSEVESGTRITDDLLSVFTIEPGPRNK